MNIDDLRAVMNYMGINITSYISNGDDSIKNKISSWVYFVYKT